MKFGKFIMNGNYISVENKKPFLDEESKHNRRAVDLYDNGGLVAFRNIFAIPDECKCVKITVAALGVVEVYINGKKVSDDLMNPVRTDYSDVVYKGLKYPFSAETRKSIMCKWNYRNSI